MLVFFRSIVRPRLTTKADKPKMGSYMFLKFNRLHTVWRLALVALTGLAALVTLVVYWESAHRGGEKGFCRWQS